MHRQGYYLFGYRYAAREFKFVKFFLPGMEPDCKEFLPLYDVLFLNHHGKHHPTSPDNVSSELVKIGYQKGLTRVHRRPQYYWDHPGFRVGDDYQRGVEQRLKAIGKVNDLFTEPDSERVRGFIKHFHEYSWALADEAMGTFDFRDKTYVFVFRSLDGWKLAKFNGRIAYFYANHFYSLNRSLLSEFYWKVVHSDPFDGVIAVVYVAPSGAFKLLDFSLRIKCPSSFNAHRLHWVDTESRQGQYNCSTRPTELPEVYSQKITDRFPDGSLEHNAVFDLALEIDGIYLPDLWPEIKAYRMDAVQLRDTFFPVISQAIDDDGQFPKRS